MRRWRYCSLSRYSSWGRWLTRLHSSSVRLTLSWSWSLSNLSNTCQVSFKCWTWGMLAKIPIYLNWLSTMWNTLSFRYLVHTKHLAHLCSKMRKIRGAHRCKGLITSRKTWFNSRYIWTNAFKTWRSQRLSWWLTQKLPLKVKNARRQIPKWLRSLSHIWQESLTSWLGSKFVLKHGFVI